MSGPEHYRMAEKLLKNLRREVGGNSGAPLYTSDHQKRILAEAQAHATLALVAATAEAAPVSELSGPLVAYPRQAETLGTWDTGDAGSAWGQVLA